MPLAGTSHAVIVGASAGGLGAAEALRAEGFTGPITLVGAEPHLPYRRPPLSKQVLTGEWAAERTQLLDEGALDALGLRLRLGTRATGLDLDGRAVLAGDDRIPYDALVIATGITARRLPGVRELAGVHTLRTLDNVAAIRTDLANAARVVVVGAGVLGSEIASAVRHLGLDVVLVGRTGAMQLGQVGEHVGDLVEELHRANGVDVRSGLSVTGVLGEDRVSAVVLSDGEVLEADVVIVAIGGVPATGWLATSGLDVSDGVVCDRTGRAAPDVHAVGDVAQWREQAGVPVPRAEHHLNAVEQALAVARLLVTGERPGVIVPFFWSEIHGTRIQAYGRFAPVSPLETIAGDRAARRFVAASREDGRITGVVGWNMPREFRDARSLVDASIQHVHLGVPT
jgi:3-phenylpropionate/trans-cinnamate dioxygenase ferredoxin reductase subunit